MNDRVLECIPEAVMIISFFAVMIPQIPQVVKPFILLSSIVASLILSFGIDYWLYLKRLAKQPFYNLQINQAVACCAEGVTKCDFCGAPRLNLEVNKCEYCGKLYGA